MMMGAVPIVSNAIFTYVIAEIARAFNLQEQV